MRLVIRGHREELGAPVDDKASRDVHHIDVFLCHLDELDDLVDLHAAFDHLVSAYAHVQEEIVANGFPDCLENHQGKPAAVLKRSAIAITSVVCQRGEELPEKIPVRRMDENAVELCALQAFGAIDIARYCLLDVVLVHLLDIGILARDGEIRRR